MNILFTSLSPQAYDRIVVDHPRDVLRFDDGFRIRDTFNAIHAACNGLLNCSDI